jgi:hypothetical protein
LSDWLDHGPQEPLQGDLLIKHCCILQAKGFVLQGWRSDRYGKFAAIFKDPSGFPFVLTSKGSDVWKGIVSMQKILLESWRGPMVLGLQPIGVLEPIWYIFDSDLAINKSVGNNFYKEDCEMINFPFSVLMAWNLEEPIQKAWERFVEKKQRILKGFLSYYFVPPG